MPLTPLNFDNDKVLLGLRLSRKQAPRGLGSAAVPWESLGPPWCHGSSSKTNLVRAVLAPLCHCPR